MPGACIIPQWKSHFYTLPFHPPIHSDCWNIQTLQNSEKRQKLWTRTIISPLRVSTDVWNHLVAEQQPQLELSSEIGFEHYILVAAHFGILKLFSMGIYSQLLLLVTFHLIRSDVMSILKIGVFLHANQSLLRFISHQMTILHRFWQLSTG